MKYYRMLILLLVLAIVPVIAQATTYTFTPYDNDVFDLDHNYLYIWGINGSIPSNETLVGATISIKDINNWDSATNVLKFYCVDNARINDNVNAVDIISIYDGSQGTTGSNKEVPYYKADPAHSANGTYNSGKKFTDFVTLATTFTDSNGTGSVNQFSYSFSNAELQSLTQYLGTANPFTDKNANFGIAFDPDCHYYNSGITLTLETRAVPEPATLLFLGLGLVGFAGLRRKFRK